MIETEKVVEKVETLLLPTQNKLRRGRKVIGQGAAR